MIWFIIVPIFLLVATIIGWSEYANEARENAQLRRIIEVLKSNSNPGKTNE